MLCQARRENKKIAFKRAESYAKEYLAKEQDEVRLKRVARIADDYVPVHLVFFVVRIER